MIVGIERPSSGIITVDGKDITNIPMYKRAAEGIDTYRKRHQSFVPCL